MKNKRIYGLIILTLGLLLIGCGDIDGDIPGKEEVLSFVENDVPEERYKLDHVDHVTDELPKEDIYYFESKERDLEFTVVSTLKAVGMDASIAGYDPYIYSQYAECVHELYKEDIDDILEQLPANSNGKYCYYSYDEIDDVVDIILEADHVYSEESRYNSEEWMEENPVANVSVLLTYTDEDGNEKFYGALYTELTGTLEYNELYDRFCRRHEEMLEDAGVQTGRDKDY